MTRYRTDTRDNEVDIELTEVAGQQAELLEAFGACQAGTCSCPTEEYAKVATMEVAPAPDRIAIHLRAKPGGHLTPRHRGLPRVHRHEYASERCRRLGPRRPRLVTGRPATCPGAEREPSGEASETRLAGAYSPDLQPTEQVRPLRMDSSAMMDRPLVTFRPCQRAKP